ncbi:MAG TPA: carboxymuconolactone decarboxylase family protein [Sphingomonas sp.]|nr:carboxymuconolactone decarboxylase family protein [Sphingomonas sp.]
MRLNQPRITPVAHGAESEAQAAVLAPLVARNTDYNIFRTMARHPGALDRFLKWASYILSRHNSLAPRTRELAILRTGYNCGSGYEWAQHVVIGRQTGLTDDEIARIKLGADAGWGAEDAAVIAACDDLTSDFFVSDARWAALAAHFSTEQCMDLVYTIGEYTQVSMLLNSFGVQLDAGLRLDPDLDRRGA